MSEAHAVRVRGCLLQHGDRALLQSEIVQATGLDRESVLAVLERLKRAGEAQCDALTRRWKLAAGASKTKPPSSSSRRKPPAETSKRPGGSGPRPAKVSLLQLLAPPTSPPARWRPALSIERVPDLSQERAINAAASARTLVEAGPGYGKTDVACARVAHLLRSGLEPAEVLLLSFTRTAVREMRERIRGLGALGNIRISTLDSFAWSFWRRLAETETTTVTFSSSIDSALARLAKGATDSLVGEYLAQFRHVLVDEAQDLVGSRALFIRNLLNALPQKAGWTVFLDPAQAIYSWSDESLDRESKSESFVDLAGALVGLHERVALTVLHRTADADFKAFQETARAHVLDETKSRRAAGLRLALLDHKRIDDLAGESIVNVTASLPKQGTSLILFRTRADALMASSWLASKGVEHRLRYGDLPRVVEPWVAEVINTPASAKIDRVAFGEAWSSLKPHLKTGWSVDQAWDASRAMAGAKGEKIDLELAATRLAMGSIPDVVFNRDPGPGGPILGTIHGSKGREADTVVLGVERDGRENENDAEEARVLYVGLSRARQALRIGETTPGFWSTVGERFSRVTLDRKGLRIEIGRSGDLDAARGLIDAPSPQQQQEWLASWKGPFAEIEARHDPATGLVHLYVDGDATRLVGTLSAEATRSLDEISRKKNGGRPFHGTLAHLTMIDVTSVGVSAEHPLASRLPSPWKQARAWLAPVVVGIGWTALAYRKSRSR